MVRDFRRGKLGRLTLDEMGPISDEEIARILLRREVAREVQDYTTADQLR